MQPAEKNVNRIERFFDFMLCVLRADGVVDRDEKVHFLSLLVEGLRLREDVLVKYRRQLAQETWEEPADEELRAISEGLEASALTELVREAYQMAQADQRIDATEVALIQRFLKLAGIPSDRFEAIDKWARESIALAQEGLRLLERTDL